MMSGAILVGILSGPLPEPTIENKGLFHNRVDLQDAETPYSNPSLAVKWSLLGFGNTAGGIGLIIALAAIVGTCMMKSGAAERSSASLTFYFWRKTSRDGTAGERISTIHSVFFDTVFFLLIPLARDGDKSRAEVSLFCHGYGRSGSNNALMVPSDTGTIDDS